MAGPLWKSVRKVQHPELFVCQSNTSCTHLPAAGTCTEHRKLASAGAAALMESRGWSFYCAVVCHRLQLLVYTIPTQISDRHFMAPSHLFLQVQWNSSFISVNWYNGIWALVLIFEHWNSSYKSIHFWLVKCVLHRARMNHYQKVSRHFWSRANNGYCSFGGNVSRYVKWLKWIPFDSITHIQCCTT